MKEFHYGTRDQSGAWTPNEPATPAPLFTFPPQPLKLLQWLPSYFLPWNILFMALAAVYWFWLTPDIETLKTLSVGWIAYLLIRNSAVVLLLYGALELRLYIKQAQGIRFKYNDKWPADNRSDKFLFKSQNLDNALRTFASGLPIWTAYEVLLLWCYANDWGPWTTLTENPVWLVVFWLLLPLYHEFHFYCIHRLIHIPFLYRHVHRVHHKSMNPSPWSSLSMHPVEHLLYWSDSLIHLILPSHPLLVLYNLHITGTGAVVGHIGFDKIELGDERALDTRAYAHHLHHKYFEVNYADGGIPIDKWTGTWHDGTKEGDALLESRRAKRRAERVTKRAA